MNAPSTNVSKNDVQNLQEFTKSAALVSSTRPWLIAEYPSQWIGVYRERVEANADGLDELIVQLTAKGVPLGDTIIRFVSEERQTLIL